MLDLAIYHYVVKCNDCDFADDNYKTAEASAEQYGSDTDHTLDVEIGGLYNG